MRHCDRFAAIAKGGASPCPKRDTLLQPPNIAAPYGLHGLTSIAQYGGGTDLIVSGNRSTRGDVRAVSGEFFDVLGVAPALGRRFGSDSGADAHVAVIGHALWRELLGAEPDLSKLGAQMPSAG